MWTLLTFELHGHLAEQGLQYRFLVLFLPKVTLCLQGLKDLLTNVIECAEQSGIKRAQDAKILYHVL